VHGVVPENSNCSGRDARKTDDRIDGRRLARTVRPEKAEKIARRNGERDIVYCWKISILLADVRDFKRGT